MPRATASRSLTSVDAAVITGAAALAGSTDGVDGDRKSVADDPVSAGVEVEFEPDVTAGEASPEPLPDEPSTPAEVST